jgi:hypothetical protein
MRDYPPPAEYEKMLTSEQGIRIAFKDKAFHGADVEKTKTGLPRARSGAFAVVYKLTQANGTTSALRLFLKDGDDRQERYQFVNEHLSRQKLSSLVPFNYTDKAFRAADGQLYPMMTMEWVKGETLFDWLQHRATAGDQKAIRAVTEKWKQTIKDLNRAQIAHGDLQHDNVMITASGDIKLVDYDGMCVPKLVGRRNLEIGVEPYQHPQRDGETKLSLSLDNFSAAFIYVGLRALAADPKLWHDFVVQTEYDKMLFRKEDFENPQASPLFQRLRRSPDADVQRLATTLHELSRVRIDQVPFLDDLLFSWDQVRVVLDQRDFDAALSLVTRGGKKVSEAPAALQPRLQEAGQRVAKLAELVQAIDAGNEAKMATEADSPLLKNYPKAAEAVAAAVDAPAVLVAVKKIEAAKAAGLWRDLVREWDAALPVLRKPKGSLRKSVSRFEAEVDGWRKRNALCDRVLSALRQAEPDVLSLVAAWKELAGLGGHPESDSHQRRVEKLVDREQKWQAFARVGRVIDEATDRSLVAAWNETVFTGWAKAQAEQSRVIDAQARLKVVEALNQGGAASLSHPGEERLVSLAAKLPSGYSPTITARIDVARQRLAAVADLDAAIAADADAGIAVAFRKLQAVQAEALTDPAQRARIDLAGRREAVLEKLKKIPSSYPNAQAGQWDPRLLAAWDAQILQGCREAAAWDAAFAMATRRKQLLTELDRVVAARDPFRAFDIDNDPCIKGYLHADAVRRFLDEASRDVAAVRGMLDALRRGDRAGFANTFSARVIRENTGTFANHWDTLLDWTRSEVLPAGRLGLGPAVGVKGVEIRAVRNAEFQRCVFRWKWPDPRFTDECRLLLCRSKPAAAATPEETPSQLKIPKTRELYQSAGGFHAQQVNVAWKDCYAVVWARIDLGSTVLWSEPLVLGRV